MKDALTQSAHLAREIGERIKSHPERESFYLAALRWLKEQIDWSVKFNQSDFLLGCIRDLEWDCGVRN